MSAAATAAASPSSTAGGGRDDAAWARHAVGDRAAPVPPMAQPAARGRLRIPSRVVQRIAAQATSEVSGAGGRSGGLFGIGAHADLDARPDVEVDLSSDSLDLAIRLVVDYPVSLRSAAQRVRDHVTQRVEQLTGISVRRVDIDIVAVGADGDDTGEGLR